MYALERIGDEYFKEFENPAELTSFKHLGDKSLYNNFSWEFMAPKDLDHCDWSTADEKIELFKKLQINCVAGFLNHGSGPRYTSLIDPEFPDKFSTFARLFARRYPDVMDYTPIDSMHVTARQSCLEGRLYPHLKDDHFYLKAMIHQCKATTMAMKEIRIINPRAQLILNEALEEIDSNDRRKGLALDLITGKVNPGHQLYFYIKNHLIRDEELHWFTDNPCYPYQKKKGF